MKAKAKAALVWLIIAGLAYGILTNPVSSAATVRDGGETIGDLLDGAGTFATTLIGE